MITVNLLHVGDSFSGSVKVDKCGEVPDHESVILITASAGNVVKATVISKIGERIRSWEAHGFIAINHRKLILTPQKGNSRSLGLVCEFTDTDDGASCQIVRDNFSTLCGTFNIKRDHRGRTALHSLCIIVY